MKDAERLGKGKARCLVLTGGFRPPHEIILKGEEKGVPLILVQEDTFTVVEKFSSLLGQLEIREEPKIQRAAQLVAQEIDFPRLRVGLFVSTLA